MHSTPASRLLLLLLLRALAKHDKNGSRSARAMSSVAQDSQKWVIVTAKRNKLGCGPGHADTLVVAQPVPGQY